jgi:hypothetical protein
MVHKDEFDKLELAACPKGKYIDFENRMEDFSKLDCTSLLSDDLKD